MELTGDTNMLSGMSAWNVSDSRKSISLAAASGCSVPASTPANSTWRKQLSSTTPVGGVSTLGSENTTSATGLEAYDVTSALSPSPPALNWP